MNIKISLIVVVLITTICCIFVFNSTIENPHEKPENVQVGASKQLNTRKYSRDIPRQKTANSSAFPTREEGYFQKRIVELQNSQIDKGRQRSEKIAALLYEWTLNNPDEAVKHMKSLFGVDDYAYELFVPAVLSAWSKKEPQKALMYVVKNPDSIPFSLEMVREPLKAAISNDKNIIFQYSGQIPGEWIESVSRDLKQSFSESGQDMVLINQISNLPPGSEEKRAFLIGMADAYAANSDWESSWKMVAEFVRMADDEKVALSVRKIYALTASWTDPIGFIKWAEENVTDRSFKEQFVQIATSDWATRDIASYSGWVRGLPVDKINDQLVINIVNPMTHDNPISALEWASQIKNQNARQAYYSKIMDNIDLSIHSKEIHRMVDRELLPPEILKK